jgi:hypothetical protein
MTQERVFQIEAMLFKVTEHFYKPHFQRAKVQGYLQVRQVGREPPGLYFSDFQVNHQVGRTNFLAGQKTKSQPEAITRFLRKITQGYPFISFVKVSGG